MSTQNISSSIALKIDREERFLSFEFTKVACGKKITPHVDYNRYCRGKRLQEILDIPFQKAAQDLKADTEEDQFVLFLEWEALRCALAHYLGINNPEIDADRCQILSISHDEKEGVEVIQMILPPQDLPKLTSFLLS